MADYNAAFKKPFTDIRKLLIGLVISILSSVIVLLGKYGGSALVGLLTLVGILIGLFLSGYYVRVAVLTLKKKKFLPEWDNWKELFLQGLFVAIISFIYTLPVLLLLLIFGGMAFLSGVSPGAQSGLLSLSAGLLVALILGIFIAYILPAGILGFIKKKKFGAAFNFREVFIKAFTWNYVVAWLLALIYGLLLGFVLKWIPYVGAPIASFIGTVTGMTLMAEAYASV